MAGEIFYSPPAPQQPPPHAPIPAQGDQPPRRSTHLLMACVLASWPTGLEHQAPQRAATAPIPQQGDQPPRRTNALGMAAALQSWPTGCEYEPYQLPRRPAAATPGDQPPRYTTAPLYALLQSWTPPDPQPTQRLTAPPIRAQGDQPPAPRSTQPPAAWYEQPAFPRAAGRLAAAPIPPPTSYLLDHFTDADGTALTSHAMDVGPGWAATSGTWTVQSNRASVATLAGGYAVASSDSGHGDVFASVKIGSTTQTIGVVVRLVDNLNFWFAQLAPGQLTLFEVTGGGFTSRATVATTWAVGDTFSLAAVGDLLTATHGADSCSFTSSVRDTATRCGIYGETSPDALDDFNVVAPAAAAADNPPRQSPATPGVIVRSWDPPDPPPAQRPVTVAPLTLAYGQQPPRASPAALYNLIGSWAPPDPQPAQRQVATPVPAQGDRPPAPRSAQPPAVWYEEAASYRPVQQSASINTAAPQPPPARQPESIRRSWEADPQPAQALSGDAPLSLAYGSQPPRYSPAQLYSLVGSWAPPDPQPTQRPVTAPIPAAVINQPAPTSSVNLGVIVRAWEPPPPQPQRDPRQIAPLALAYGQQPPRYSPAQQCALVDAWRQPDPQPQQRLAAAPIPPAAVNQPTPNSGVNLGVIVRAWEPPDPQPQRDLRQTVALTLAYGQQPPKLRTQPTRSDEADHPRQRQVQVAAITAASTQPPPPRQPPSVMASWQVEQPAQQRPLSVAPLTLTYGDQPPRRTTGLYPYAPLVEWAAQSRPPAAAVSVPPPAADAPPPRAGANLAVILAAWEPPWFAVRPWAAGAQPPAGPAAPVRRLRASGAAGTLLSAAGRVGTAVAASGRASASLAASGRSDVAAIQNRGCEYGEDVTVAWTLDTGEAIAAWAITAELLAAEDDALPVSAGTVVVTGASAADITFASAATAHRTVTHWRVCRTDAGAKTVLTKGKWTIGGERVSGVP